MNAIVTTLIVIAIIVAAILIGVAVIRYKLNKATRKYLGKSLNETTKLLSDGLKEEASMPKPIANVSPLYMPALLKDFPDMTQQRFVEMAKSSLLSILDAIEKETTEGLNNFTRELVSQIDARIADNAGKGGVEHFDDIKIHKTAISNYKSTSENAHTDFDISFQCKYFFTGDKKYDTEKITQFAARITFAFGKEEAEGSVTTYSHNCPNCGAPIYSVDGKMMVCKYCGTGVTHDVYKSWLTSAFKFI